MPKVTHARRQEARGLGGRGRFGSRGNLTLIFSHLPLNTAPLGSDWELSLPKCAAHLELQGPKGWGCPFGILCLLPVPHEKGQTTVTRAGLCFPNVTMVVSLLVTTFG